MSSKMFPDIVPMTDDLAKKIGFINKDAYANYKKLVAPNDMTIAGKSAMADAMLVHLVNLEQMVLESQRQIEKLRARLTDTGTERIG